MNYWLNIFGVFLILTITGCSQASITSIALSESELIELTTLQGSEDFISKWDLDLCHENEMARRYCNEEESILLDIIEGDGIILTLGGVNVENMDELIRTFSTDYEKEDLKSVDGFQEFIDGHELKRGYYYYNESTELVVADLQDIATKQSKVVFTVNRTSEGSQ